VFFIANLFPAGIHAQTRLIQIAVRFSHLGRMYFTVARRAWFSGEE
jgi:hypothetical protein